MTPSPRPPARVAPADEGQTRIENGIEWFKVQRGTGVVSSPLFVEDEDCQCARCGSSCDFRDCGQCDHGFVERDGGDGIVPDPYDAPCEWCNGRGGSWHCISSPDYCAANPLPGRAHIESTALRPEAWTD